MVHQVICDGPKKFLGDSGRSPEFIKMAWTLAQEKIKNRAECLFNGPKTPKNKEQSLRSNDYYSLGYF